jgi:hypothetical protein
MVMVTWGGVLHITVRLGRVPVGSWRKLDLALPTAACLEAPEGAPTGSPFMVKFVLRGWSWSLRELGTLKSPESWGLFVQICGTHEVSGVGFALAILTAVTQEAGLAPLCQHVKSKLTFAGI